MRRASWGAAAYWGCVLVGTAGFGFFVVLAVFNYAEGNNDEALNRAINAFTLLAFAWMLGITLDAVSNGAPASLVWERIIGFYRAYLLILVVGSLTVGFVYGLVTGLAEYLVHGSGTEPDQSHEQEPLKPDGRPYRLPKPPRL